MAPRNWFICAIVFAAGCDQESHHAPAWSLPDGGLSGAGGVGGSAGHAVSIEASSEGALLRAQMTIHDVAFGDEGHLCMDVRLTNDEPVWVTEVHATIGAGSHHMIVSRQGSADPAPQATECFALLGGETSRLVIAQQPDTRFTLPSDAGFRLMPHETITIQIHYINASDGLIDVGGQVELLTAPQTRVLSEARVVFTGNLSLSLPPNATSESLHFELLGTPDAPLHVFALTSHTHKLGVRATISRSTESGPGRLLHESLNWEEPPLSTFDPVLVFDGSDGLAMRCEYNNTTNQTVSFGTSFHSEMCFMWLYAY